MSNINKIESNFRFTEKRQREEALDEQKMKLCKVHYKSVTGKNLK